MRTYTLTLTNHTTRAAMTVKVTAHSYNAAVDTAWRRWCKRSNNQVVVK